MKVNQDIDCENRRHKEEDGGGGESKRPKGSEIVTVFPSNLDGAGMSPPLHFFTLWYPPSSSSYFLLIGQSCLNPIRNLLSKVSRHFKSWWVSFFHNTVGDYRYRRPSEPQLGQS